MQIGAFVADYEVGPTGQPLTRREQLLITNVITDYVCHEQWLAAEPDADAAIQSIKAATQQMAVIDQAEVAALLSSAAHMIADLAKRLSRRE
ncbi:MAG: hypothetical protein EOO38_15055, partial [Cytophagaceae bacterium]